MTTSRLASKSTAIASRKGAMIIGKFRHLHFVGIGGAGMSGMAEVLADVGYTVTGSDIARSEVTDQLEQEGIRIHIGHDAANVGDAHVVVISSAVHETNPEVMEAIGRNIPVIKRAEMLGELMRLKFSIGIAGCHGKTTTTALTGHIFKEAGLDPTVIVGGRLTDSSIGAKVGAGDYMVVEADEYDRSFLVMYPAMAVVTNLEADHLDIYRDLDDIKAAFLQYVNRTPFYGQVIINADDQNLYDIAPHIKRATKTFGTQPGADYQATAIHTEGSVGVFTLLKGESTVGTIRVPLPGQHNVMNALCAATIALESEIPFDIVSRAIAKFPGVVRRFQLHGEVNGRSVYDDYAHHPSEVRAALDAARQFGRPVTAVFQPHLYSRTRDFAREFAESLSVADRAFVVDIYPAREKPMPGVTSQLIIDAAKALGHNHVVLAGPMSKAATLVAQNSPTRDLVMTIGAGDIYKIIDDILKTLERQNK